jgi:hypothetical protein
MLGFFSNRAIEGYFTCIIGVLPTRLVGQFYGCMVGKRKGTRVSNPTCHIMNIAIETSLYVEVFLGFFMLHCALNLV